jgi:hypothetical protein
MRIGSRVPRILYRNSGHLVVPRRELLNLTSRMLQSIALVTCDHGTSGFAEETRIHSLKPVPVDDPSLSGSPRFPHRLNRYRNSLA